MAGKRFVFDHHDLSPEMYRARFEDGGNRLVFAALVFFEKWTCWVADQVIATNESYRQMEMLRCKVPSERITIVRNGPNLNRVRLVAEDAQLRSRAGIILGYVGVMGVQDGIDYLLRAVAHMVYDLGRRDVYCVLIGDGDARTGLIELAEQLRVQSYVWFTGEVSDRDLLRYLSTADICVDPDPFNPFNDQSTMIKIMEYMALRKPIVAFDLTEHRASAGDAAVYAARNDELDFARKIIELADNPQRRTQMGDIGRRRVENHLSWEHQQPNLLAAYEALLPLAESAGRAPEAAVTEVM